MTNSCSYLASIQPPHSSHKVCTHCKRPGHLVDKCFKIIGYPEKDGSEKDKSQKEPTTKSSAGKVLASIQEVPHGDSFRIIGDTGCTHHLIRDRNLIANFKSMDPIQFRLAGTDKVIFATGKGDVYLLLHNGSKKSPITLKDVYYVENLEWNLFSISQSTEYGYKYVFEKSKATIQDNNSVIIGTFYRADNSFWLDCSVNKKLYQSQQSASGKKALNISNDSDVQNVELETEPEAPTHDKNDFDWHKRFAHLGITSMKKLPELVDGYTPKRQHDDCELCKTSNISRSPFNHQSPRTTVPGERIHLDVCGPLPTTLGGRRYFCMFVDDASRFKLAVPLYVKSDTFKVFVSIKAYFERQTGNKLKYLRCDGGGENLSNEFKAFISAEGIIQEVTPRYTPQMNGVSERAIQTVVTKLRAVLHWSNMPHHFWGDVLNAICVIDSRSPCSSNPGDKTPFELFHRRRPNVSSLLTLGAQAIVQIPSEIRNKLDPKGVKGFLIGYQNLEANTYRFWCGNQMIISRDFVIYENRPAFDHPQSDSDFSLLNNEGPDPIVQQPSSDVNKVLNVLEDFSFEGEEFNTKPKNFDDFDNQDWKLNPNLFNYITDSFGQCDLDAFATKENAQLPDYWTKDDDAFKQDWNGKRLWINPPFVDLQMVANKLKTSVSPAIVIAPNYYDEQWYEDLHKLSRGKMLFLPTDEHSFFPKSNGNTQGIGKPPFDHIVAFCITPKLLFEYANAAKREETDSFTMQQVRQADDWPLWKEAIDAEISSLEEHDTYTYVDILNSYHTLNTVWVLKVKRNEKGEIVRRKARLCVQGFKQRPGIDYMEDEIFSPVVRHQSLRLLLKIAIEKGYRTSQFDVKTAFLNGIVDEDIYVNPPDGYKRPGKIWKLKKSLYGIKQAPKCWHKALVQAFKMYDFLPCEFDPCVFTNNDQSIYVAVYVDDLLVIAKKEEEIKKVSDLLNDNFKMQYNGELKFLLGWEIKISVDKIMVSQEQYIRDVLARFNMEHCDPYPTPLSPGTRLSPMVENSDESIPYRSAVGSLMYLATGTRPDIAFAVGLLSRRLHKYSANEWTLVKHVLRYLKNTIDHGIHITKTGKPFELIGYSDADFAGDPNDSKSTSGYIFLLNGTPISWKSKKQSLVTLSSAESEYVALSSCIQEGLYLRTCLIEIGLLHPDVPIEIFEDNNACKTIAEHTQYSPRTKHINLRFHFVRSHIQDEIFKLTHVNTKDQIADVFTKAVSGKTLDRLKTLMNVSSTSI